MSWLRINFCNIAASQLVPARSFFSFYFSSNRKEGNVLFNDALNTFYLRLYGITHHDPSHHERTLTTKLDLNCSSYRNLLCGFVRFVYVNINQSMNCIPVLLSYPVKGRQLFFHNDGELPEAGIIVILKIILIRFLKNKKCTY